MLPHNREVALRSPGSHLRTHSTRKQKQDRALPAQLEREPPQAVRPLEVSGSRAAWVAHTAPPCRPFPGLSPRLGPCWHQAHLVELQPLPRAAQTWTPGWLEGGREGGAGRLWGLGEHVGHEEGAPALTSPLLRQQQSRQGRQVAGALLEPSFSHQNLVTLWPNCQWNLGL